MTYVKNNDQILLEYSSQLYQKSIPNIYNTVSYYTGSVIKEIVDIYFLLIKSDNIQDCRDHSTFLTSAFQRLDNLIAQQIDDKYIEEVLYNTELELAFDVITRYRSQYYALIENEQAHSILESHHPWDVFENVSYFSNYLQLAQVEYEGAGLKPGDRVVFLGSGPMPLTLIVLCHQYGLKGIGIEQDPKRVNLSKKVLSKLGLSNQIKIIEGNHQSLPLKEKCELIMVAAQAEPKKDIFNHMAKVFLSGTVISYRKYEKGLRRLLDTFSRYELPDVFQEYRRVPPKPPVNNTVVFLIVNKR
ncbi:MAG: methyltransferase [Methanosarcinales archaeon]|nr:methyltransferase [Methanosarcinales archaeon]